MRVNAATQQRELAELRGELPWLKSGASVVQQGALRDLDKAFVNFFEGRGKFPRFKRRTAQTSFVIRDVSLTRYSRKWGGVRAPKAGVIRFRIT